MNADEFDVLFQETRASRAGLEQLSGVSIFDLLRATDDEIARAEEALETQLPEKYKDFMRRYGGGQFLFLDLLPIVSPNARTESLLDVNQSVVSGQNFISVASVGTGDWWGFVSTDGVCEERVSFLDHEDGSTQDEAEDFLEFVARRGLSSNQ